MFKIERRYGVLSHYVMYFVLIELVGYALKLFHPVLGNYIATLEYQSVLGFIWWLLVVIYGGLSWLVLWIAWPAYLYFGSLVALLVVYIAIWEPRQAALDLSARKIVVYNAKKMAQTYVQGQGFGKYQTLALLSVIHTVLCAGCDRLRISAWIVEGMLEGHEDAAALLLGNRFEIVYPSNESQPVLLMNDIECPVH
jgi:hypothetical protein